MGSVPTAADWFIWDKIIEQDAYLDCASPYPGVMGTWLEVGLVVRYIVSAELVCSWRELRLSKD